MQTIKIHEVKTKRDYKTFLNLPELIYAKDNKHYVRPLNLHMNMMIGKIGKGQKHLFIAFKDDKPVARIGIKVNTYKDEKNLHFGFFEALPDNDVAVKMMIEKAHSLYPDLVMRGPYNFRMEDPYIGILVKGFELDPYFLMSYNPEYYGRMLEGAGLVQSMDLITYSITGHTTFPDSFFKKAQEAKDNGISVRWLNPKKMKEEVRMIASIFNESLDGNWGFEEMHEEQIKEMYLMFKLFIDHRIIAIAQKDGKDIGCLIMIPNYNPILKKSNGSLSLKLILSYFLGKKKIDTCRGYALGVLKKYHGMGVGTALMDAIRVRCTEELNIPDGEISWVLSSNDSMNALAGNVQGKPNKTYRVFDRAAIQ